MGFKATSWPTKAHCCWSKLLTVKNIWLVLKYVKNVWFQNLMFPMVSGVINEWHIVMAFFGINNFELFIK